MLTDLDILTMGSDFISYPLNDDSDGRDLFINDLSTVFANRDGKECVESESGCYEGNERGAYFIGQLGDTVFANIFRDTKYYIKNQDNNQSNQIFHVVGGGINFSYANDNHCSYFLCMSTKEWMTFHETTQKVYSKPSLVGECGSSYEDLFLSFKGEDLGLSLRSGTVSVHKFGSMVHTDLSYNGWDISYLVGRIPSNILWGNVEESDIDLNRLKGYWNTETPAKQTECSYYIF